MKRIIATALVFGLLGAVIATAVTAQADDPVKKHVVTDDKGNVVNVIVWDSKQPYSPGSGRSVTPFDPVTHKGYGAQPPTPTPTGTPILLLNTEDRLALLEADVAAIKATLGLK